jgi:hypothetical protein
LCQDLLVGAGDDINSLFLPVILPVVSAGILPILPSALTYILLKNQKQKAQGKYLLSDIKLEFIIDRRRVNIELENIV